MNIQTLAGISNKTVLVTGGAGSIGKELVNQVLLYRPRKLIVLDINESGLFYLQEEIKHQKNGIPVEFFIADIRDRGRLEQIINNIDTIFHAAALKHVPLCESNPFEAIKTNVFGTQNLIEIAINTKVERFLTISTDKAVNPINTMGATKLLAEKLTLNSGKNNCVTKFSCVRFGNVLNSVGSVMPIFLNQISYGGPITLTDIKMTRFFMSMSEAVKLIIKASSIMQGGEIFILKMRAIKIFDLAQIMREILAPRYKYNFKDIDIQIIGIRPGEKMYEELINNTESNYVKEEDDIFIINYNDTSKKYECYGKKSTISDQGYNSRTADQIPENELRKILIDELKK